MNRLLMMAVLGLPLCGCAEMQADMRAHPEQWQALSASIHQATVDYGNAIDPPVIRVRMCNPHILTNACPGN